MEYTKQDVLDNMGLVYKVAHRMRYGHTGTLIDFDDLVSEGILGLIHALERWAPGKGAKLSTYAGHCIRFRILEAHRQAFKQHRQAKRLGLPAPSHNLYLDAPINEDDWTSHDILPGKFESEQDLIDKIDVMLAWENVWQHLRSSERKAVKLILSGLSQVEASRVLGVTPSAVSQSYNHALGTVRTYHSKPGRQRP